MSTGREFDIVLYGATGYSGRLTAEYLAARGSPARIALAGRDTGRLQAVRQALGPAAQDWPLLVADAAQPSTLAAVAERTQVVATTVGPYAQYGLPLVAACARAGTDYADLTGELMFVRDSIDLYHKQAVDTGARIVTSCGFDSVPSDLNVYQLHRRAVQDGTGELTDTNPLVSAILQPARGIRWHGCVATRNDAHRMGDAQARRTINDPYTFTTDREAEPELGRQRDFGWRRGRDVAPELDGFWVGGFVMGPYNARIVRRSNALQDWSYGTRFRYSEALSLGRSFAAPVASAIVTAALAAATGLGNRYFRRLPRRFVELLTPKPGAGPGDTARKRGHYTVETYSTTTTGARYMATFGQSCDAYQGTAVMLGESGLALALDRDRLSELRGVLTPAAAMGDPLLARLSAAGVSVQTTRLS